VKFFVGLHRVTIAIYNSPKQNEEDEEHTNGYNSSHVKHLVELISNKNTKYSEEEHSNDPCPHQDCIYIHPGAFTGATCIEET